MPTLNTQFCDAVSRHLDHGFSLETAVKETNPNVQQSTCEIFEEMATLCNTAVYQGLSPETQVKIGKAVTTSPQFALLSESARISYRHFAEGSNLTIIRRLIIRWQEILNTLIQWAHNLNNQPLIDLLQKATVLLKQKDVDNATLIDVRHELSSARQNIKNALRFQPIISNAELLEKLDEHLKTLINEICAITETPPTPLRSTPSSEHSFPEIPDNNENVQLSETYFELYEMPIDERERLKEELDGIAPPGRPHKKSLTNLEVFLKEKTPLELTYLLKHMLVDGRVHSYARVYKEIIAETIRPFLDQGLKDALINNMWDVPVQNSARKFLKNHNLI